jgi:hypothetical protein
MEQINAMPEEDVFRMLRMWNNFIAMEQERARAFPLGHLEKVPQEHPCGG